MQKKGSGLMKRSLLIGGLSSLCAVSLFATNGDNLIALGVVARAMGGTGIAHFSAGASATGNPALIVLSKGGEFTFGATYLAPSVDVKTSDTVGGVNDLSASSSSKHNTIPYAALTHNLGNGFSVGGSIFGAAGMGTDWTKGEGAYTSSSSVGLYSMKTNLTMLKVSAPVAYQWNEFSFGVAPVMIFGTLGMSYVEIPNNEPSSDTGFGVELGVLYQYKPLGINIGAVYHSPISLSYHNQISAVSKSFGYGTSGSNLSSFSDELEQPAELGVGVDWRYENLSLTADYRNIYWGEAKGYKNFNWENQSVYALGAEYKIDDLSLRCGYNYGKNPIKAKNDATPIVGTSSPTNPTNGDVINTFNHVMFPAITEQHYTLGAGYQFNNAVSADVALIYARGPEVTVDAPTVGLGKISVTNDQYALSAAINVIF
jgi:long-chain fatty acid transport protein